VGGFTWGLGGGWWGPGWWGGGGGGGGGRPRGGPRRRGWGGAARRPPPPPRGRDIRGHVTTQLQFSCEVFVEAGLVVEVHAVAHDVQHGGLRRFPQDLGNAAAEHTLDAGGTKSAQCVGCLEGRDLDDRLAPDLIGPGVAAGSEPLPPDTRASTCRRILTERSVGGTPTATDSWRRMACRWPSP
jgi:hypothetical protein